MRIKLGNHTVTIHRAPLVEDSRDHSLYRAWLAETSTVVKHCMVEPYPLAEKLNIEILKGREYSQTAFRVYAPAGTSVLPTDEVTYNGQRYEVFGEGGIWDDFDGTHDNVTFIIRLRRG